MKGLFNPHLTKLIESNAMKNYTHCLHCNEQLIGRSDKKFCDDSCRNGHYNQRTSESAQVFRPLISRLKANYRALQKLKAQRQCASLQELALLGFNAQFCTHTAAGSDGTTLYCFNIGYRITPDQQLLLVTESNPTL